MAARYHALVSGELMADEPDWPDGLRLLRQAGSVRDLGHGIAPPGSDWWLFADDDASPEWNGRQVELTLTQAGPGLRILIRKAA